MFRARTFVEGPSKRLGDAGLLATDVSSALKRQRLEHWDALYARRSGGVSDAVEDATSLLVDTRRCTIVEGGRVPPSVLNQVQKEWHLQTPLYQRRQVRCCRASVPSSRHRSGRQWVPFFVFFLRNKVLLWQQEWSKVIALQLPGELESDDVVYPFLFALDSQSLSLLVVAKSGLVLFWEDIELPYESIPLSVQIPLDINELVYTHDHAAIVAAEHDGRHERGVNGLICWSNQGNVWEVAVEDRRIRVRAFEKQSAGLLAGITKSVSQFFFSSTGSGAGADKEELDVNQPITCLRVLPSSFGDAASIDSGGDELGDTSDMLVLFQDGMLERRSFNIEDVLDCSCVSQWHFNAGRVATSYFSNDFPEAHLAKVHVISVPYVHDACVGLLVAFICSSSRSGTNATVKYALVQFSLEAVNGGSLPTPQWVHMLDFEPAFDGQAVDHFIAVESFSVTRGALYLVWTQMEPVEFCALLLPRIGQPTVRSTAFPLQGTQGRLALAFGARADQSLFDNNAVRGSVLFLLIEEGLKSLNGSVCMATASDMQKLELFPSPLPSEASAARARRRREASYETNELSRFGEANLTVEDYVRLILTHFHEAPNSAVALRVSVRDVRHAAQAAVIVDLQILDAKSSSGLRWEKGAPTTKTGVQEKESDTLSVTPKLVRYQLEEKKNRHMALLEFLQRRCVSVWEFIENSTELQCELAKNEEKLQAAIALCKLQASILSPNSSDDGVASETLCRLTGKFILHAIEKTVVERGYRTEQLRLAGYNSFDVFYSEVSKITELFERLNDEVQSLSTAVSESDPAYLCGLLESGCAMLSMLCTPVQGSALRFAPTGSWTLAHEVRKVVVNQISRLSTLVGYSQSGSCERQIRWQYDEIFVIIDQIRRLGTVLLDDYGSLIPLSLRGDADDLRAEEAYTKRVTLNPLVYFATQTPFQDSEFAVDFGTDGVITRKRADLFHQCVELCEKYCYFEGMVYLVLIEDSENLNKLDCVLGKLPKSPASKRLESYCKKHKGFDDFIFCWCNGEVRNPWTQNDQKADASSRTMLAYLLAHSQLFAPLLHKFMNERDHLKKYCWLTAISIERYDQVVTLALQEAKREQQSLPKRKTMASIAKIAAFASPSLSHPDSVQEIDRELVRGKLQELLLQLPLELPINSQPLSPEELVDTCLASAFSVEKDDPMRTNLFLMALEALDAQATDPLTEKYKEMRADVWRSCIVDDGKLWDDIAAESAAGVNEENTEVLMRQTLMYKAMKEYASRPEHPVGARPASALTIEVIEELVRCEDDVDSAMSDQTQQLLMKTLHLALQ